MINSFNLRKLRSSALEVSITLDGCVLKVNDCKFTLSIKSYDKLYQLHVDNSSDDIINTRIFNLLCRYESLAAPGYHAGIPKKIFELLREKLEVSYELFASPFNCTLEKYCSAYPDTDKWFGSQGNFFNVYPKLFQNGGSFEANPPFLEEHMATLSLIVESVLSKSSVLSNSSSSSVALSFVIFYPAWTDAISYQTLLNSKFNVLSDRVLNFERADHYYMQSSQYWGKKDDFRISNSRSAVFILQNEAGKLRYPITDEFIKQLNQNFKNR